MQDLSLSTYSAKAGLHNKLDKIKCSGFAMQTTFIWVKQIPKTWGALANTYYICIYQAFFFSYRIPFSGLFSNMTPFFKEKWDLSMYLRIAVKARRKQRTPYSIIFLDLQMPLSLALFCIFNLLQSGTFPCYFHHSFHFPYELLHSSAFSHLKASIQTSHKNKNIVFLWREGPYL